MELAHWGYRTRCSALKLRGKRRWALAVLAALVGVFLTVLLIVISAIPDTSAPGNVPDAATGSTAALTATLWWKVGVGFAVFILGVAGNLFANSFQKSLDAMPRDALVANKNHHLSTLVGEAVRVILLVLVDSKPPSDGITKKDSVESVTPAAKRPLTDMAAAATDFWRGLVLDPDPSKIKHYAGLHEPTLSKFIIDPKAIAMDAESWTRFLNELHSFAKKKTGRTAVPFANPVDLNAAVAALGSQFGRSFREALKWDSTHDGLGWAAMQLQVAGQLLSRVGDAGNASPELNDALVGLRDAYDTGFNELKSKIDRLESASQRRHREMLSRLGRQHTEIMAKLSCMQLQITDVARVVGLPTKEVPSVTEGIQGLHTKIDGLKPVPVAPPTDNLAAANVPNNAAKFKGRVDELTELHRRVNSDPPGVPIPVIAAPGLGKSALVTRYVYVNQAEFDHIWWLRVSHINGKTNGSAEERSLAGLLDLWGIDSKAIQGDDHTSRLEALAQEFRAWLSRPKSDGTPVRHLVVLDNVEDYATMKRLRLNDPSRVVFTARAKSMVRDGAIAMELKALSPQDGLRVLRGKTDKWDADTHTDLLSEMGELVGWNALALVYLGSVLARPSASSLAPIRNSLAAGLASGRTGPIDTHRHDERPDDYDAKVEEAFALFIEPYSDRPEMAMLDAAALCAPDGIALGLLRASSGLDADAYDAALDELESAGVFDLDGESISIHRLTQVSVRGHLAARGPTAKSAAIIRLLDAMIAVFHYPATQAEQLLDHTKTPARLAAVPHAEAVMVHAEMPLFNEGKGVAATLPRPPTPARQAVADDLSAKVAFLRGQMAIWLPDVGMYAAAETHLSAAITWGEAQSPRDERGLAIRYASRASIRQSRGDLKGAEEDIARSITWGEAQSPRDERGLAIWYASRASIRRDLKHYASALNDVEQSLAWGRVQTPVYDWGIAVWSGTRGTILVELDRVSEAVIDISDCIAWHREQQPERRDRMSALLRDQARILAVAGEWERATDAMAESVPLYETMFGPDHEWTSKARVWQSSIASRQVPPAWLDTKP